ncbi:hypothetical protein [Vallicoccus soli]|uniref:DUF2470 domain-containing protein n=1 Tax=Vallicoccus soli TaxID=2339232 RepID=A0A3A3Z8B7_9ACTN|nr:hypothetical protein [Vallicoccus soli]RJK98147.1 hypothetical protein D5H78_04300 [Vallicoccus soli]
MSTTAGELRTAAGPTPGERARTVLRAAPTLVLRLLDGGSGPHPPEALVAGHRLDPRGAPLLVLADDDPVVEALRAAAAHGLPDVAAVVEGWALVPVPVADRVRGTVRLDGWAEELDGAERARLAPSLGLGTAPEDLEGWTLVRLDVADVTLADGRGRARVAVEDYAAAVPDPLVDDEPQLLEHVAGRHPREVALLAALAGAVVGGPVHDPVVVGVDRFGLRLRVAPGGALPDGRADRLVDGRAGGRVDERVDVHLPFAAPLRHPGELAVAVAVLLERARRCC